LIVSEREQQERKLEPEMKVNEGNREGRNVLLPFHWLLRSSELLTIRPER